MTAGLTAGLTRSTAGLTASKNLHRRLDPAQPRSCAGFHTVVSVSDTRFASLGIKRSRGQTKMQQQKCNNAKNPSATVDSACPHLHCKSNYLLIQSILLILLQTKTIWLNNLKTTNTSSSNIRTLDSSVYLYSLRIVFDSLQRYLGKKEIHFLMFVTDSSVRVRSSLSVIRSFEVQDRRSR